MTEVEGSSRSGRRRGRIGIPLTIGAAGLLLTFVCPADAEEPLTGAAAWERIVGNTVSGTTPDGPYAELLRADGSFTIVDNDGKGAGRWTLRDGKLCTQADDEEEECRSLSVLGKDGTFIDEAGSRYAFEIVPGNPKGL
ncbi:MAG: hypothetical protein ACRYGP_32705 [Janthinobacterium lividum]